MNQEIDIRACKRLLSEIGDLCDHASLTGSLSGGAGRTAQRYNSVLARLVEAKAVDSGLFSPLPESAGFDETGVEAKMLSGYLSGDKKGKDEDSCHRSVIVRLAPFIGKEELNALVREQASTVGVDVNLITSLAPFLGEEYLSSLVRENLLKGSRATAPVAPAPPAAEPAPAPLQSPHPVPMEANEQGVGHLLDMLQDSTLTEVERQHVIERIRIATG